MHQGLPVLILFHFINPKFLVSKRTHEIMLHLIVLVLTVNSVVNLLCTKPLSALIPVKMNIHSK